MDTKKIREAINEQSTSPMDHGGEPRKDDTGWPEGPDGVRRPRMTQDHREDPEPMRNEDQAAKQVAGELPLPPEELEEVEEEDEHGKKTKVKRKKSKAK